MKTLAALTLLALLIGCSGSSESDDEGLTTETEGSALVIKRNGAEIARILNSEDGFSAQISGGDGKPDMHLSYYEDESSTSTSNLEVVSRNVTKDGEDWLITYDDMGRIASEGRLLAPNTVHDLRNNKQNRVPGSD